MPPSKKTTQKQLDAQQQQIITQMQEAIQRYDEMDPKDRLVLRLATAVADLDKEVVELQAARAGWAQEMSNLQDRIEALESQIRRLTNAVSKASFPDLVEEFVNKSKKRKAKADKKAARDKKKK